MAGHSKWAQIKRKKATTDAKKSKIFSKLMHLLSVQAKLAKGDRTHPGLRLAIDRAKAANVPSNTIERAIEKGSADGEVALEEVMYEAYGPGGVAILAVGLTDNRNRTAAEVKQVLSKHKVSLAAQGAAAWAFTKTEDGFAPQQTIDLEESDLLALEKLVDELEEHNDIQDVVTNAA